jgi:hypothetical protein
MVHFFVIIHRFEISVKFCVFLILISNKITKKFGFIEYIYEYFLELVECKFARNGSTN